MLFEPLPWAGKRQHRIWPDALAIFGFLLTIYLLTFSGLFTSVDELALYAKTESLVQNGGTETPQLNFAAFHNQVGSLEIGFSAAAVPLYWLAQQIDWLNKIHTVMLLNPLLTAATSALVYAITRTLGYSRGGSAIAALAYGMATLAWPYARSFYREPLVALGWTLGLYGLVLWRYEGRRFWALVGGVALVMTVLVKVTAIAGLPFIFLAALAMVGGRRKLGPYLLTLGLALLAVAVLFQYVFALRYGSVWDFGRFFDWTPAKSGLRFYGQLLSPGKGLLFYMPVVLLTIPGLVLMWRRHRAATLAVALPLLATAIAYSGYAIWYGGQSWGPRFLVPALPLLMVSLAPLWDEIRAGNRWLRGLFIVVISLSVVIQLSVTTADWWLGFRPLFKSGPDPEDTIGLQLSGIRLSPPLVQVREWATDYLDLLWLRPGPDGGMILAGRLAAGLAIAAVGVVLLWWLFARRRLKAGWLVAPPLLATGVLLWWGAQVTPGYTGLPPEQARELASWASGGRSEPYTVVTMSNEFHIYYYLGFLKGDFVHHWYSPNQTEDFEPILANTKGEWLALVLDRVHIDPTFSGKDLEWWMNEQLYRADSAWIGDYELVRYANVSTEGQEWHEVGLNFGDSFVIKRMPLARIQSGLARPLAYNWKSAGQAPLRATIICSPICYRPDARSVASTGQFVTGEYW